jgi:aldose 1-epimerase
LQTDNGHYFGIIVGRCANRIANATFTIDNKQHKVTANDGPHSLHGGKRGWGMQVPACGAACTS